MNGAQEQKGLHDFLNYCMEERLDQIEEQFNDAEYEALEHRNSYLFGKIKQHLPEDIKDCIFEYEDNANKLCVITERYYYKAGFKDSMNLSRHALGISIIERNL